MEKVIYSVWRDPAQTLAAFESDMLTATAPALLDCGARGLQIDIRDPSVARAMGNLFPGVSAVDSLPDAAVHVWMDTAIDRFRLPFDALAGRSRRMAAYLVTESAVTVNPRTGVQPGARVPGFSQLAFLQRPARLSQEEWLDVWFNDHTQNAVTYHACLSYIQNIVVRCLTDDAPALDALVEESFVMEAAYDPVALYRVGDDRSQYAEYRDKLIESSARMVDFDKVGVIQAGSHVWSAPLEGPAS